MGSQNKCSGWTLTTQFISIERLYMTKWWPHTSTLGESSQALSSRHRVSSMSPFLFSVSSDFLLLQSLVISYKNSNSLGSSFYLFHLNSSKYVFILLCFVFCPQAGYIEPGKKIKTILQVLFHKFKYSVQFVNHKGCWQYISTVSSHFPFITQTLLSFMCLKHPYCCIRDCLLQGHSILISWENR